MDAFVAFAEENLILVGAFVLLIGWVIWSEMRRRGPKVTATEAVVRINAGAAVIDLRPQVHFDAGTIAGATHALPSKLTESLRKYEATKDKQDILLFCETGRQSRASATLLERAGWANVHPIQGGAFEWRAAGLPLPVFSGKRSGKKSR